MIDAFAIGVSLTLNDAITGQLSGVASQFDAMQQQIDGLNASLKTVGGSMAGMARSSATIASNWQAAAKAAQDMAGAAGAMPSGSGVVSPMISSAPAGVSAMPGSGLIVMPGFGSTQTGPQSWGHVPITGYGGGFLPGAGSGGAGGPPPNWVYGDEPFNPGPPKPLDITSGGGITVNNSPMHLMSDLFFAQAAAGVVARTAKVVVSPSFDLQQQEETLASMGATPDQITQAVTQAGFIQKNPKNPGITLGQALAMITDLYSVDRNDFADVLKMSTGYAEDSFVLSQQKNGGDAMDVMYNILRSGEDAGKFGLLNKQGNLDLTKINRFDDLITRMIVNSGGNLSAEGILTMFGAAGPGITQMSDTAIEKALLMSQSLGSSQTGTGINAMYQEFIGGKMSQGTARALHDAGVLPDYMFGPDDKILKKYRFGIGMAMIPEGALKGEAEALSDPFGWSTQYLFGKYMNADGTVKTGNEKTVETLIADLNRDYSRIPGMKDAGYALFQGAVMDRQLKNIGLVPSVSDIATNYAGTGNAQAGGASAAFNAFLQAFGSPLIPGATKGLNMLITSLNAATTMATNHPERAEAVDEGFLDAAGYTALKILGILPRKLGGGLAAGAARTLEGPLGEAIVAGQLAELMAKALANALTNAGLDGRDVAGGGYPAGSSPGKPLYIKSVDRPASNSPTMPSGPTTPPASTSLPNPGKPLPR